MTKDVLFSLTKGAFAPQEEMLEVARKKGKLYIGIPKEIAFQEKPRGFGARRCGLVSK